MRRSRPTPLFYRHLASRPLPQHADFCPDPAKRRPVKQELAKAHWKRATKALSAANRLAIGGEYQDSVSRSYYAIMHAAKAALATKGIEARSHTAVQKLFSQQLVKTGEVNKERGGELGDGRESRTTADYDV